MIDQQRTLGPADRTTLRAWRVSNVAGWSIVALLAAFVVELALADVQYLIDPERDVARAIPALLALVGGAAIGAIVGRRVYRSVELVAAAVAALFVLRGQFFVLLFMLRGRIVQGVDYYQPGQLIVYGVLTIVTATVFARLAWRRRPVALRGGRGSAPPE